MFFQRLENMATFYKANTSGGKKVWFTESGEYEERVDNFTSEPLWDIPLD